MTCRSCGLGPSPVKRTPAKPTTSKIVHKSVPTRAKLNQPAPAKKPSIPTRSPGRTFNTLGE